jgi:hypothetical protein
VEPGSTELGKEILYCNRCGKQLLGDDFTRGRAHTFENRQFCTQCLPATHLPKSVPVPSSPSRLPKRPASSTHLPVQGVAPPGPSGSALFISLAVGAGVLALLLVLFLNPSKPQTPPSPDPVAPRPVPLEAKKPADEAARKAVEQAREFSAGSPHAVDERVRLWEQAVARTAKTSYADEALKGLERAVTQRKEEFAQELQAIELKLSDRIKMEQFGAAADVLEEAKKRHETSPEWTAAVSRRIREVQDAAEKLYPEVKAKAIAAQASGDEARVAELRKRLLGWGRRDLLADLEDELGKALTRQTPPPGATLLFRFPPEGGNRPYRLAGTLRDGALVLPVYNKWAVLGGFESLREPVAIPSEGEIWVTYSTNCPKPFGIRFRVIQGDKTWPYNWWLNNPEVGRPARVRVPMTKFKDANNQLIGVGDRFATIYFQQDDPKAELLIFEALIVRTKE